MQPHAHLVNLEDLRTRILHATSVRPVPVLILGSLCCADQTLQGVSRSVSLPLRWNRSTGSICSTLTSSTRSTLMRETLKMHRKTWQTRGSGPSPLSRLSSASNRYRVDSIAIHWFKVSLDDCCHCSHTFLSFTVTIPIFRCFLAKLFYCSIFDCTPRRRFNV